ncbi:MAG: transcription-repair coupling factor [Pseudomonadota bacterium]
MPKSQSRENRFALPAAIDALDFSAAGRTHLASAPEGVDALVAQHIAAAAHMRHHGDRRVDLVFLTRDAPRLRALAETLHFFAPDVDVITLPGWDCLPYDRVSPSSGVLSDRLSALAELTAPRDGHIRILAATVGAAMQRLPAPDFVRQAVLDMRPGRAFNMETIAAWLERNGFMRTSTVREEGEYAVRGGIIDLFAAGHDEPVRLDFFGDTLESIRSFDAGTQRTLSQLGALDLKPMSEVVLSQDAIDRFRDGYRAEFGGMTKGDALYESVAVGRRYNGAEHWLPLFHDQLATLFGYADGAPVLLDPLADDAFSERRAQVDDYYDARRTALDEAKGEAASVYKPLPPDRLYLDEEEWRQGFASRMRLDLSPGSVPDAGSSTQIIDLAANVGRSFAPERQDAGRNVYDALIGHIRDLRSQGRTVGIACFSEGSQARMADMLSDHGLSAFRAIEGPGPLLQPQADEPISLFTLPLEHGFEIGPLVVIGEQDILGERFVRPKRKTRRPADAIMAASSLSEGDYIVHVEHGIGQFAGLATVAAAGAPHECAELHYAGGDKLFLPVENIDLLSRYGAEDTAVVLDKLGGVAWQARKARLKERIREMAGKLIDIAAKRALRQGDPLDPPDGLYHEFCARFPYPETEDQLQAIEAVEEDLQSGHPMDRLVCGDVGFGKTEVALRAAFIAAASGKQVAVVVPTTLLARQHFATFAERFRGFPLNVAQASRMVGGKQLNETKRGLADGSVDIVVGTHALLSKSVQFQNLGLVVIDEEQHFGVAHKERLKEMRASVHVLTLSATPIPRTLQLAMTGLRDLSMIATPPIDRLAVRSYVSPFDPLVLREALLRERYRGGQSFFVCPRISDLDEARSFLAETVPEVSVSVAHGQMPASDLEDIMSDLYDGKFDVLLSTAIVESGLDIPTANTLVVYRADVFGLSQLYQLRGRVGRSKTRAYAYFTHPANRKLTDAAEKRLKILQSLEGLGAGFMLASHDLDLRGAGNLLGEEQSGHIKEVGYELYQSMLEEAVQSLRDGGAALDDDWSPQLTLGVPVMIPSAYVPDTETRLSLYRRFTQAIDASELNQLAAEMADRFGPPPPELQDLVAILEIKLLCKRAGVARVDAGPKGVVLGLRNNRFENPAGLVQFISSEGPRAKIRADHSIVLSRIWPEADDRLKGTAKIVSELADLAAEAAATAA